MPISSAPVQEKASNAWASGTTITISGFTTPTNGNALIIYFDASAAAVTVASISQTGATWVRAGGDSTTRVSEIWYALNVSGAGTTITINLNSTPSTAGAISACLSEWSGLATSGALDTATGGTGTGVTTIQSPTVTPAAGTNVLILACARASAAVSAGPTGGFTALTSADASVRAFGAYRVESSAAGSYSTTWTQGTGAYSSTIAVFKAPGAAGISPATYLLLASA